MPGLKFLPLFAPVLLGGCVTLPNGPSVLVLPGTGKSFDEFRADDATCQQYAYAQVGGLTASQAASESGVRSAAVGTALGAAAGSAIGAAAGTAAGGAAVGAGTGLLMGSLAGTGAAQSSAYGAQQRYDFSYEQCMYAKGHRVPVTGQFITAPEPGYYPHKR